MTLIDKKYQTFSIKAAIKQFAYTSRNKLTRNFANSNKNKNINIYHCCIQKTGSQWLMQIFKDFQIFQATSLDLYKPEISYLNPNNYHLLQKQFPLEKIIAPLYISYDNFKAMPKPDEYKAFFVQRDMRDIVVSLYFALRYSHQIISDFFAQRRKQLDQMNQDEGLMLVIKDLESHWYNQKSAILSWLKAKDDKRILICRYEDIIGEKSIETFQQIFDHIDINISRNAVKNIVEKYNFQNMSKGRKQGNEDQKAHYRKGVAGDWENYFNDEHKAAFKKYTGDLLIQLGYENDMDW